MALARRADRSLRARRRAAWTGVLGALALNALPAVPAAAGTRDLVYEITWGDLILAEGSVSHTERDGRYVLSGKAQTTGLFGLLYDWEGAVRTEGIAAQGKQRPLSHKNEGILNGSGRKTLVDWHGDGAPRARTEPPLDQAELTPVPAASIHGAADPLTALLSILGGLNRTGRCEAAAKVWDGRRRYDLVVQHLGPDVLVADRPWSYAGPSVKCRLRIDRIGGFRREPASWKAEDDTGERAVWAADMGGGRFVPVRAELETAFGTLVGRLKPAETAEEPTKQAEIGPGFRP